MAARLPLGKVKQGLTTRNKWASNHNRVLLPGRSGRVTMVVREKGKNSSLFFLCCGFASPGLWLVVPTPLFSVPWRSSLLASGLSLCRVCGWPPFACAVSLLRSLVPGAVLGSQFSRCGARPLRKHCKQGPPTRKKGAALATHFPNKARGGRADRLTWFRLGVSGAMSGELNPRVDRLTWL